MNQFEHKPQTIITDPEESRLLERLIDGDISGYEILFHKHYPSLHALIRGMTRDSDIADDIAQNVFMKVWINRSQLDPTKSMRAYLFVLARNEIYNYMRTKCRTFTSLQEAALYPDGIGGGKPADTHNEIEDRLDLDQTAKRIEEIIDNMPGQRQRIFRLSRFEHLPNKEIARQLDLSVRTVDKHLELALKELRRHLGMIPAIILFLDILP